MTMPGAEQDAVAAVPALRAEIAARAGSALPSSPAPAPELTRRLDLLWRGPAPSTRGRPPRFSLDQVVSAAVAVADEQGLDGVTMRAVAAHLGSAPMSLYTYVPAREDLIDLMVDACYATLELPDGRAPWRVAVEAFAEQLLAMHLDHPWMLELNRWQLPLAPHVFDADEALLRALEAAGLPAGRIPPVGDLILTLVHGYARAILLERASSRAGLPQEEYWARSSSFWGTHFDPARYPTMTRLWLAGAYDQEPGALAHQLAPLLDGIESAASAASAADAADATAAANAGSAASAADATAAASAASAADVEGAADVADPAE